MNTSIQLTDKREALARALANKPLSASPQAAAMLKYLVEEALGGRESNLKAYTVGVDALGKPANFDPQTDPSVRVLARSLRQALIEYYARDGKDDPVRIEIPTGSYQPKFVRPAKIRDLPPLRSTNLHGIALTLIAVALVAALFAITYFARSSDGLPVVARFEGPRILIQPFTFAKDPPPKLPARELAIGISAELVSDMARYPWLSVVMLPDEGSGMDSLSQMATASNPPHYILSGKVSERGNHVLVAVTLQSFPALKIKWTNVFKEPFDRPDFDRLQYEVSAKIAAVVGSENGIVPELLKTNPPASLAIDVDAFRCFMEIYPYWNDPAAGRRAHLQQCLQTTVAKNPGYAEAWAALAYVYVDEAAREPEPAKFQDLWTKADVAIAKALEISPLSPVVLRSAMAWSLNKPARDLAAFERYARKELELRPNNPDSLAEIGTRLAVNSGKWDEGLELVAQAFDLNPRPPAWYYLAPALRSILAGGDDSVPEPLKKADAPRSIPINLLKAISAANGGEEALLSGCLANLEKLGVTDFNAAREFIVQSRLEPELDRVLTEKIELVYKN